MLSILLLELFIFSHGCPQRLQCAGVLSVKAKEHTQSQIEIRDRPSLTHAQITTPIHGQLQICVL